MTSESENIIATGRCQGLSKWLISLEPNMKIKLTFHYFSLYKNKQWVKIRNGKDSNGDLLAISSGVVSPSDVTSTSNYMLVEFMSMSSASSTSTSSIYPSKPLEEIHVHGFIASYIAIGKNYEIQNIM